MFRTRRSLLSTAAVLAIAVVALACGGGPSNGDGDGGGNNSGSGNNNVAADLRLIGGDPVPSLDPAICGNSTCATYIYHIFSGLVSQDQNFRIIPDLAESWDISPAGTVYTFRLRRNATFHDGRPVTAEDFKYSFDRAAKLANQGGTFTVAAYFGDIIGARDVINGRASSISGVKVVDNFTLEITIDAPKPYFLAKMTYLPAFVVDKQQVEANARNWTRKPNATGPYRLVDWRIGVRLLLEANDRYALGAPAVKRVLFDISGGSSLTRYENDEIDVAGIGVNDIERVQSTNDPLNKEYKRANDLSIGYVGFNVQTPPFDDPKVRQAFAMAVDREQINRVVNKDLVQVANSVMMPGLPGYDENSKALAYNPTMAKQLLSESKYRDGAGLGEVKLSIIGAGATSGPSVDAMIEQWKQNLGVTVRIEQSEEGSFFDDLDRGKLQMYEIGWHMDYPDPENIIDLLFYSKSSLNNSHYSSPQVDALIEQARTELNSERRIQLYRQAEQIIIQDAPWMPLNFGRSHFVVKPRVQNFDPRSPVYLRYVTVNR